MKPVIIGETFGWFSAGRNRRGVVLCGTLGHEQHLAHRWWRDLSEGIAGTGCAVVRFDYPGEGDSKGSETQLGAALDAIRFVVRFLRDEVGVEEIVLVGLRLGGTLAALVAVEGGVDRLVLLAPFPRGRAYLREMELQGRLIDILPDGGPLPKRPGTLSVGGFTLSSDLRQDLSKIDLRALDRPPARRILLLGPDPAGLAARFADQGARVETGDLPEFATLLSDVTQGRMLRATRAQILRFASKGARPSSTRVLLPPVTDTGISGAGWRDEPVQFGDGLFAMRCRPSAEASEAPVVLLINMGADAHSGYGRQTTTLARTLAENGVVSLRMDLRGIGDSTDRPDGRLPFYHLSAVEDIRAAIDVLTQGDARPVIAVGTCNGAYLAFHAICQDQRIAAAVLANLHCFDWELNHAGETYTVTQVRHVRAYAAMLLKAATWRRILGGVTPIGSIARTVVRCGLTRVFGKLVDRHQPGQTPRPIQARIAELRRRGARLVMLFSAGDLGLRDLHAQLGPLDRAAAILGEPVHIIADVDHTFAAEPAQAVLLREIQRLAATLAPERAAVEGSRPPSAGRMRLVPQRPLQIARAARPAPGSRDTGWTSGPVPTACAGARHAARAASAGMAPIS